MLVNNTIPAMRVDEVWELESIADTDLYLSLGIVADTHTYYDNGSYYFFTNATGTYCSSSTSPIPPQNWPSSTFVGEVDFEGQRAYQFNQTYSRLPASLYVSIDTFDPIA